LGAETVAWPAIRIEPLPWTLDNIGVYDWAVFTSANGVRFFFERISDVRDLRARICAIGPATRASIQAMRLKVDLIGDEFVAESLLAAFDAQELRGKRILIARAEKARDVLPEGLRQKGALVDVLPVYRTVAPPLSELPVMEAGNWILFTSSSIVENTVAALGVEALRGLKIASIGPVTSGTARNLGLEVTVEASPYTTIGLVNAILGRSQLRKIYPSPTSQTV
jgi:uroporphyrinogen III methyltransferase/synthase